jgi:hypothetical protein
MKRNVLQREETVLEIKVARLVIGRPDIDGVNAHCARGIQGGAEKVEQQGFA